MTLASSVEGRIGSKELLGATLRDHRNALLMKSLRSGGIVPERREFGVDGRLNRCV